MQTLVVSTALAKYIVPLFAKDPALPACPLQSLADLHRWDFSRVTVRLVATIQGTYVGYEEMAKVGMARLNAVLREESWVAGAGTGRRLASLEMQVSWTLPLAWPSVKKESDVLPRSQCSSLCQYRPAWVNQWYGACRGDDPKSWVPARPNAPCPPFKVIFRELFSSSRGQLREQQPTLTL